MKKIILLLLIGLYSISGFSQIKVSQGGVTKAQLTDSVKRIDTSTAKVVLTKPLTFVSNLVIDTVGIDTMYLWNTTAYEIFKSGNDANPTIQPLTYGRVRANLDLASTTHINTDPGTKIPFNISTYLFGMTDNAGSLIPSVSGRYRADWLCMSASTEFLADGIFFVVQNGVSVGQVSFNMNEASAVNQSAGFVDVDLVAGQEVSLHYRTRHTTTDGISWDRGSYFQLTQLPTGTIQVVENTIYEDNIAVLGSSVNVPNTSINASNATDVMSFTIPSAGVWELKYNVRATTPNQTATSVTGMVALITNNSNVVQSGSEIAIGRFQSGSTSGSGNNLTASGSGVVTITTAGAETFKLRSHHDGSANGSLAYSVQSDNNGRTKVSWVKKTAGLPANIVDNTLSGYFDIGNMRMQWGTLLHVPSSGPITLPAAFANANYTVVVSSAAGVNIFVTTSTKTTTNFTCVTLNDGGSPSSNNPISYYAIGQKP